MVNDRWICQYHGSYGDERWTFPMRSLCKDCLPFHDQQLLPLNLQTNFSCHAISWCVNRYKMIGEKKTSVTSFTAVCLILNRWDNRTPRRRTANALLEGLDPDRDRMHSRFQLKGNLWQFIHTRHIRFKNQWISEQFFKIFQEYLTAADRIQCFYPWNWFFIVGCLAPPGVLRSVFRDLEEGVKEVDLQRSEWVGLCMDIVNTYIYICIFIYFIYIYTYIHYTSERLFLCTIAGRYGYIIYNMLCIIKYHHGYS